MITGEEKNDEVRLALTGTDSHWSNCEPRLIFKAAGEHDLVLVVPTVLNQNGWFLVLLTHSWNPEATDRERTLFSGIEEGGC